MLGNHRKFHTVSCEHAFPVIISPSFCPLFSRSGSILDKTTSKNVSISSTMYMAFPPNKLCCFENANSDVNAAGPMALAIEAVVWLRPFIAPSEYLFGDALVTIMKMTAEDEHPREPTSSFGLRK